MECPGCSTQFEVAPQKCPTCGYVFPPAAGASGFATVAKSAAAPVPLASPPRQAPSTPMAASTPAERRRARLIWLSFGASALLWLLFAAVFLLIRFG
jgi:hypothetical protein